jgi:predicted transcriptional regulator of viral defense system
MTNLQIKFISLLDDYGYDVFNLEMIRNTNLFHDREINSVIRSLTRNGLLNRIERGKYVRSSFSDDNVIANFMAIDGGIAYWSALNAHGLTEQFANRTFIQTAMAKKDLSDGSRQYKFIKVPEYKLFGYKTYGFGNHTYKMTDVEKTIIDCFDLPQYSGWYQEIIKAFNNATLYQSKMIKYCKLMRNNSLIKRLGFLADFLEKPKMEGFIIYAQDTINRDYSLFEIGNEKEGEYDSKWKLVLNIPRDEILEIANS